MCAAFAHEASQIAAGFSDLSSLTNLRVFVQYDVRSSLHSAQPRNTATAYAWLVRWRLMLPARPHRVYWNWNQFTLAMPPEPWKTRYSVWTPEAPVIGALTVTQV